jgi:hypothetical protein
MKKFKVQQIILCEVSVWGYVEADSMPIAMGKAIEIGTGCGHDHEIISDIKTISIEINEVTE